MNIQLKFIKRTIAGEVFLVPIGETAKQYSGLFALSEVGAFLWDLIPDAKDEEDLLHHILDEYEVSEEQARADLKDFLSQLRELHIIP